MKFYQYSRKFMEFYFLICILSFLKTFCLIISSC